MASSGILTDNDDEKVAIMHIFINFLITQPSKTTDKILITAIF